MKLYSTLTFCDVFPDFDSFKTKLTTAIPLSITDDDKSLLYYLLYARYGNSPISNSDENQWVYKLAATINIYYPEYAKRKAIQEALRNLTEADLTMGGISITNHANNPSTAPASDTTAPLPYIDDQLTNNNTTSKMSGYAQLWSILDSDYTVAFLDKFKYLFKRFIAPTDIVYCTEED